MTEIWNFSRIQKRVMTYRLEDDSGENLYRQEAIDYLFDILARSMPLDLNFYLGRYADLRDAVEEGRVMNLSRHFIEHGFYEDRVPSLPLVNESEYLAQYPDVSEAIRQGKIASATEHWDRFGRNECREAYLLANNGNTAGGRP